ncbi:MAG: endonuclease Q family protein [Promethearchaeota archaeon]
MQYFDADLHIHSPHSIAVSKNMNLDSMINTCKKKGLSILGTGDVTQPEWRQYLRNNLKYKNGVYSYKGVYFIIQTELEDEDSVHHVILLPTLNSAEELEKKISSYTKDTTAYFAGRPHVHLKPPEIVELVEEVGGISGPAHAFTPFKSIFRANRYKNLEECYGNVVKKVFFLELGLSADTYIADRMKCLENITYLSNSDAHSEGVQSLGREFNRFDIEEPSYDEIVKAIKRQDGRKIILNVGMEPRLGKYPMMFCRKCRTRVRLFIKDDIPNNVKKLPQKKTISETYSEDETFIYYIFDTKEELENFKAQIRAEKVLCQKCKSAGKKSPIILGVFDRIDEIADYKEPKHPDHRPPYLDIIPLVEMIRVIKGVKSVKAKSVIKIYDELVSKYGTEFNILTDKQITDDLIKGGYEKLGKLIKAFHNRSIEFIPGGGGKYGEIRLKEL